MATFTYVRNLRGITITLTTANTKYSLDTLLRAVDSTIPVECHELVIQNDPANTGNVSVGDVNLSTTRRGYKLASGDSRTYVNRRQMIDIRDIYLMPDANSLVVNVEVVDF